ncbi:hypothetical protein HEO25_018860 [Escherichia coli]|nr:hypothetical protein [Escherichia coli]
MEIRFASDIDWIRKSGAAKSPVEWENRVAPQIKEDGFIYHGFVMPWNGKLTRVACECPTHGFWYTSSAESIFLRKGGCPRCADANRNNSKKVTEEMAVDKIAKECKKLGFEFLGFVGDVWQGYYTKLILRCPKHDHTWDTTNYANFISGKAKGCVKCRLEKSNKSKGFDPAKYEANIARLLEGRDIVFLGWVGGACKNSHSRMILKCLKHGETWDTTTYTNFIRRPEMGCSQCTMNGFRVTRPAWIYVQDVGGKAIKFGITNRKTAEDRMKQQANKSGLVHKMLFSWHFEDGKNAYDVESIIKQRFKDKLGVLAREVMPDGFTETLPNEILPNFLKDVKSLCNEIRYS